MTFFSNTNNILLIILALASGGLLLWPTLVRNAAGAMVGPSQATRMMNDGALVVDLRSDAEFAEGHILKSRNIALADVATRMGEIEKFKNKPILLTCGSGARAGKAAQALRSNGFTQVVCLEGGLDAWKKAGLPVVKSTP